MPAGHRKPLSKDRPGFYPSRNTGRANSPPQRAFLNNRPPFLKFPTAPRCPQNLSFSAKPPTGIARRAGRSPSEARKLPEQRPRSPRGMVGYGSPLKVIPWEWRDATNLAGSSGGSAEGASPKGLCLAAPPRPPSAARRAGGPIENKEKPPCPQGTTPTSQRTRPALLSSRAPAAHTLTPSRGAATSPPAGCTFCASCCF